MVESSALKLNIQIAEGKLEEAWNSVSALLEEQPENPVAWHLKGKIFSKQGDKINAIACYNQALKYKPDFAEACADLARTLEETGQLLLAVKFYEYLLKIEQSYAPVKINPVSPSDAKKAKEWFHKGEDLQKKNDPNGAASAFRKALTLQPDLPEALTNLGIAQYYMQQLAEAEETLLHCLQVKPWHADALNTLGTIYKDTGRNAKAIAVYRQVLAHAPDYLPAAINLGNLCYALHLYDETIKAHEQVLAMDPANIDVLCNLWHLLCQNCDWPKSEAAKVAILEFIEKGKKRVKPFTAITMFPLATLQFRNARKFAKEIYPEGKAYNPDFILPASKRNDERLHIGYVSSDFHEHATTHLISELFELHDRNKFKIFAYSTGKEDTSKARARIMRAVDGFRDVRAISDKEACALIAEDGVDILVDIKGYTKDNRFSLMAPRAAPIQMHYLGFPGTTGAPFIDYFISDHIVSPKGADAVFSECLIRFPYSYQMNDSLRPLPEKILSRSAYGLPEEGFVFCDFNTAYKITPEMFAVWMKLLLAIEGSVLWLSESTSEATKNLQREAQRNGVDPSRIIMAPFAAQAQHLPRYAHADLVIDTAHVCGHTTASDALWCGVPVVTMAGESFISRVAASLLHAVNLPELITENLADYEKLAVELATNPQKLVRMKRHLAEGRKSFPLFNTMATTRALEAAYQQAAKLHQEKTTPRPFNILPDLEIAE